MYPSTSVVLPLIGAPFCPCGHNHFYWAGDDGDGVWRCSRCGRDVITGTDLQQAINRAIYREQEQPAMTIIDNDTDIHTDERGILSWSTTPRSGLGLDMDQPVRVVTEHHYTDVVRQLDTFVTENNRIADALNEERMLVHKLRENIRMIGERLIREAHERDWCTTFDDVVNDLNSELYDVEGGRLPTRTFSKRIMLSVIIRVEGNGIGDNIEPCVRDWLMHDIDNDARLTDRAENRDLMIHSAVVQDVHVADD